MKHCIHVPFCSLRCHQWSEFPPLIPHSFHSQTAAQRRRPCWGVLVQYSFHQHMCKRPQHNSKKPGDFYTQCLELRQNVFAGAKEYTLAPCCPSILATSHVSVSRHFFSHCSWVHTLSKETQKKSKPWVFLSQASLSYPSSHLTPSGNSSKGNMHLEM